MKIWVDDIREYPDYHWWWVKDSWHAIQALNHCMLNGIPVEVLSLDHDLGGDDTTRPIVLWLCEHNVWPDEIRVHTANPVGREWLEGMIERYKNA
jgi:hypothetical protein